MKTANAATRKLSRRSSSRSPRAAAPRARGGTDRRRTDSNLEYAGLLALAVGLGLVESPLAVALLALRAMQLVGGRTGNSVVTEGIESRFLHLLGPILG